MTCRIVCGVLAIALLLLAVSAMLVLAEVNITVGLWAHFVPAAAIDSLMDYLGLEVSSHGAIVRSAHGPPFLAPFGIALVYVLPATMLGAVAVFHRVGAHVNARRITKDKPAE